MLKWHELNVREAIADRHNVCTCCITASGTINQNQIAARMPFLIISFVFGDHFKIYVHHKAPQHAKSRKSDVDS